MILPQSKRVVRFDAFPGKTIQEVVESLLSIRILFTDGTFADIEANLYRRSFSTKESQGILPQDVRGVIETEPALRPLYRLLWKA